MTTGDAGGLKNKSKAEKTQLAMQNITYEPKALTSATEAVQYDDRA